MYTMKALRMIFNLMIDGSGAIPLTYIVDFAFVLMRNEMPKEVLPEIVVGTCMDRRLNFMIDNVASNVAPEGNFVVVRSAGATLRGLEDTIDAIVEKGGVKRIQFYTHTDCGACHFVCEASRHQIDVSKRLGMALVHHLTKSTDKFCAGTEVEAENIRMLKESLAKYKSKGIEVKVEEVNMNTINAPKEAWTASMTLVVGKPYSGSFEELAMKLGLNPWTMFSINAERIVDVIPDIDVAILALKIRNIKIVSTCSDTDRWSEEQLKVLRLMDFMREGDIFAEVVKLV